MKIKKIPQIFESQLVKAPFSIKPAKIYVF